MSTSTQYKLPRYVVGKTASVLGWTVYDRAQEGLSTYCNQPTEAQADLYAAKANLRRAEFYAEQEKNERRPKPLQAGPPT
jgi:hypothetical protein